MQLSQIQLCLVVWSQILISGRVIRGSYAVVYSNIRQRNQLVDNMFHGAEDVTWDIEPQGTLDEVAKKYPKHTDLFSGWAKNMQPNYAMLALGLSAL